LRHCLVQDEEVDLFNTELLRALIESVQGLVISVVGDPNLRFDEQVLAGNARSADTFADLPLIAIRGGSVDMAVANLDRRTDRGGGLFGDALVNAQPHGGHLNTVVKRDYGVVAGHYRPSLCVAVVCSVSPLVDPGMRTEMVGDHRTTATSAESTLTP
jgi:hypothetical protein